MADEQREEALKQIAGGLVSILLRADYLPEDLQIDGWMFFFSVVERHLSSRKFEDLMRQWQSPHPML